MTSVTDLRHAYGASRNQASSTTGKQASALARRLPAVCDFSITNVCNAACGFCGFARDKALVGSRLYVDANAVRRALPILHRRGIRYITLQGGEPLVHPDIVRLVAEITAAGMQCALITNGWFLPRYIRLLAEAGLRRLIISIDSASLAQHEHNRGLGGLEARIRRGIVLARSLGVSATASVTVSRLVCYQDLPHTLREPGFDGVEFSYPRREPLGSSSLVYGGNRTWSTSRRQNCLRHWVQSVASGSIFQS